MLPLASPSSNILALKDGSVGWLILNRPERRNALTSAMWTAIPPAMAAVDADPDIRVIVLRGAGSQAFAAGADICEFGETRKDAASARDYERRNAEAFAAIRSASKPVIAMISGHCIGGGLALALACDLRIASDSSQFALPPAKLGLAYPLEGLRDLLAAVSPSVAKEMIFTARRIDAVEAKNIGLINRLVALDQLESETAALGAEICARAPLTLKASKRAIDAISDRPGAASAAELQALAAACFDSADYAEGCAAFLEKRKPVFTGK